MRRPWTAQSALTLVTGLALLPVLHSCREQPSNNTSRAAASASNPPATSAPARATPAPSPTLKPPYNVLLVMIDSLRWDMPWNGYPRPIAPWLTQFEQRCVSYRRAYSLSSYTAKSVAPALAGKYPSEMPRDGAFFTRFTDDNVLLSEQVQAAGHTTLAGHGHGYFMPALGLSQGFSDYRLLPGTFLDTTGVHTVTSQALNELAKKMLSDNAQKNSPSSDPDSQRRFFAYFHFLDPHYTYIRHAQHPDWGNGRRDLYDNEVHHTDHWVGDLVDWVQSQAWGAHTAVIVTADHGEGFGEHGQQRHAYELWEALVRVPWFICVPGLPGRVLNEPRGHIDLAPTVLDLMAVTPIAPLRGQSLLPEMLGAAAPPRPVLVDLPRADLMDRRRAVIAGDYKLIAFGDDASWELYNVGRDPAEEHDLSRSEPAKLNEMKALYRSVSESIPTVPIVGPAKLKGAPPGRRW